MGRGVPRHVAEAQAGGDVIRYYVVTTQMEPDPTGRQEPPREGVVLAYTAADAITQADLECSRRGYDVSAPEGRMVSVRPRVIAVRPAVGLEGRFAGIFDSF